MSNLVNDITSQGNGDAERAGVWLTADEFLARYGDIMFVQGRKRGLTREDAEDLVVAVGEIVLAKQVPADPEHQFASIVRTAHNVMRNMLRKHRPQAVDPEQLNERIASGTPSPQAQAESIEFLDALRESLDSLSRRDQEIIRRLFLARRPLSYAEVADLLGVRVDSVGPLRARALDRLRRQLELRGFEAHDLDS